MINRIRDIRLQKGLTLADVALACDPPTTAQTIGRLETGMRNLSLVWMNRIAAALQVDPQTLLRSEGAEPARIVATLGAKGAEGLRVPIEAVLPHALASDTAWHVLSVEASSGEYRAHDQVWLQPIDVGAASSVMNRDVLALDSEGQYAFGRLIEASEGQIALLPPVSGQDRIVISSPAWLAVAEMLVRKL